MVVACHDQDAAMRRAPGRVAVLERVPRAVYTRSLAIPKAEHAVVLRARKQVRLLGAPNRRRGQILVEAGLKADVGGVEETLRAPKLAIEAAERRAPIPGHESGRPEPGALVAVALRQEQAHERLEPGQEKRPAIL